MEVVTGGKEMVAKMGQGIIHLENSIGEYEAQDCPLCPDEKHHKVLVCRVCSWPPAMDGRCVCDQGQKAGDWRVGRSAVNAAMWLN